ncbi:MAG: hypothetical protein KAS66_16120 [Candidatus Omnitrophica bacterium]|nr:hypothetical protein [Candidatus Omnitrophota bacterium]
MLKKSKYLFLRVALLSVLMFVLAAAPAGADTFKFFGVSIPPTGDTAIGEDQFTVDVTAYGTNQVKFRFENEVGEPCSITDVYFADGTQFETTGVIIDESVGVDFEMGATPGHPPGADGFEPTMQFYAADSESPPPENGVDAYSEWLDIIFILQSGQTIDTVLGDIRSGDLKIALHSQAYEDGGSETFTTVPIPPSVLLLGSGLIGLVGFRRKKIAK